VGSKAFPLAVGRLPCPPALVPENTLDIAAQDGFESKIEAKLKAVRHISLSRAYIKALPTRE
jgi:hypothetical protein